MSEPIFIIAEAGVNHNGNVDIALRLIDAAKQVGADAVKFQFFTADQLVARSAPKADYQLLNTSLCESQWEMLKRLELNGETHRRLKAHCKATDILYMASAFDHSGIQFLADMDVEVFKIPSGELTNPPYLKAVGALGRRIIMSTGMCTMDEIGQALGLLTGAGTPKEKVCILHCNTDYPTAMDDVNLRAMVSIRNAFGISVGYSDHTLGIEVPIAAVALGAAVIEKHFTLDHTMDGPDHRASLDVDGFRLLVRGIRNVEAALGDGIKRPSKSELKNRPVVRKSIVASCAIQAGDRFSETNLTIKRPGTGISPLSWELLVGKRARRSYTADELIETDEL